MTGVCEGVRCCDQKHCGGLLSELDCDRGFAMVKGVIWGVDWPSMEL